MYDYKKTIAALWSGRQTDKTEYLYQVVKICEPDSLPLTTDAARKFALLGYCVDEGVLRNQGRPGAFKGPDAIRTALATLPIHFNDETLIADLGNLFCRQGQLEAVEEGLAEKVTFILQSGYTPLLLGGGHDIAFGHYKGIHRFLPKNKIIGIINFDAHFDLREDANGPNSGTPFYQIAREAGDSFRYLCLGIKQNANSTSLFNTAGTTGTQYLLREEFSLFNWSNVEAALNKFISNCDVIYCSIDLDGFSAAYAPGVSAPSPFGFDTDIAVAALKLILHSKKMISLDIAEMNPEYDIDGRTAKLAAGLLFDVLL